MYSIKVGLRYQMVIDQLKKLNNKDSYPTLPKKHLYSYLICLETELITIYNYPHVAIIGRSIDGVALITS